jgi:GNAT superfamily N-acetyltransferase
MPGSLVIRPAAASDAAAISALVAELGYPASSDEIPGRLIALESSGHAMAVVAEFHGSVVGLVTAHVLSSIHSAAPVAWLTTLIVLGRSRGAGIGRKLVAEAESWARMQGAARIAVTSGAQRSDAHDFYKRLGYAQTGVRFGKTL